MRPTREGRHSPFRLGLIESGLGIDPDAPDEDPEEPINWAASSNSGQAFVPFTPEPEAGPTEDLNLSVGTDSDGGGTRPVVDAANANDANLANYAYRASFFNGGGTQTWYLVADLGAAYEISELVVRGGQGNSGENDPPWEFAHSDNGSTWTTAVGAYVWDGTTNPRTATLTLTSPQTKRYWRIGHTILNSGLIYPVKVNTWEINGATVGAPANDIWIDAPLAIDGTTATYEGVSQEHSPFLRHTLDDTYLIDQARLVVAWTSNTARTITLQGGLESDYSDATTLATHTYTPTGGFTADTLSLAWTATDAYQYFQYLTNVENWYRVHESELYASGVSASSVASNALALGGVVVGNAAASNTHFVALSSNTGLWLPHVESASGDFVTTNLGGGEQLSTVASSGTTETIDLATGNVHDITLSANCTFTFTGAAAGRARSFTLFLRQDGTGSRTATWPGSVVWSTGAAPTLSTAANSLDVFTFVTLDGGTVWYGFSVSSDSGVADHLADTTDAHDASAVSFSPGSGIVSTDVQGAIEEAATLGAGEDTDLVTVGATGATETIDVSTARYYDLTLDTNCTLTLSSPAPSEGHKITLILRQDGTGNRTVTWPAEVYWPSGVTPTLATGAYDADVFTLITTKGGSEWLGIHEGAAYPLSAPPAGGSYWPLLSLTSS